MTAAPKEVASGTMRLKTHRLAGSTLYAMIGRLARPGDLTAARYAAIAALYLLVYLSLNVVTGTHQLNGSGITLWSPDNALSILLILKSTAFAPIVAMAQIVSDLYVSRVPYGWSAIFSSELILAFGYLAISIALRDFFGFRLNSSSYSDRIAVLAVAPLGAAMTGLLYCGSLTLLGVVPSGEFLGAFNDFWIGDTAAIGVALPAAAGLVEFAGRGRQRIKNPARNAALIVVMGAITVGLIFFSASSIERRYTFDLVFLPILFVGLKFGYSAASLFLLGVQLALLAAVSYFNVDDRFFRSYQIMMFILAVSGQALGAAVTRWQEAMRLLQKQQADLARVSGQAATSVMAAAMAHEISQPLASLNNYVHSARRVLENTQNVDVALSALRKAEAEASRARQIIERIRDFIASGNLLLERVDLDVVSEKIVRLNRDNAQANGVALRCVPEAISTRIDADRVALEQAFNNLVVNAIEATGAGGEVIVRVERAAHTARFIVEDNGPGVSAELGDRIFQVFETTKARGMGLGLPLCKQIAERHGGRLIWRPRLPQGACFEIELPLP